MTTRRPILLGIAGDSAAGKTTITQGLMNILGADSRNARLHRRLSQVRSQASAQSAASRRCARSAITSTCWNSTWSACITVSPSSSRSTSTPRGTLVRPEYVQPRQFVIVEGLLGFSTPTLRQFYDVKVYLDPPENMRKAWKLKRDTTQRGYTAEQVLAELERREPDSRDFIRPQREYRRHRRAVLSARRAPRRKRRGRT